MVETKLPVADLAVFDRNFWDGTFRCTRIGTGSLGSKAGNLVVIKDRLAQAVATWHLSGFEVSVPTMAVIATDCFDEFIQRNSLNELPVEEMPDDRIGHAFQQANLPVELLGDLRALSLQVKTPLAIRSSSLLEDGLDRPFAGVYATKMIPNNQLDPDTRFRRLMEAIKFVYASTYFREARNYIKTTGHDPSTATGSIPISREWAGRSTSMRFLRLGLKMGWSTSRLGSARPLWKAACHGPTLRHIPRNLRRLIPSPSCYVEPKRSSVW